MAEAEHRERAFVSAARRPGRDITQRISSAIEASKVHFLRTGRLLYITQPLVEANVPFDELDEDHQFDAPEVIIPDGLDIVTIRMDLRRELDEGLQYPSQPNDPESRQPAQPRCIVHLPTNVDSISVGPAHQTISIPPVSPTLDTQTIPVSHACPPLFPGASDPIFDALFSPYSDDRTLIGSPPIVHLPVNTMDMTQFAGGPVPPGAEPLNLPTEADLHALQGQIYQAVNDSFCQFPHEPLFGRDGLADKQPCGVFPDTPMESQFHPGKDFSEYINWHESDESEDESPDGGEEESPDGGEEEFPDDGEESPDGGEEEFPDEGEESADNEEESPADNEEVCHSDSEKSQEDRVNKKKRKKEAELMMSRSKRQPRFLGKLD